MKTINFSPFIYRIDYLQYFDNDSVIFYDDHFPEYDPNYHQEYLSDQFINNFDDDIY